jgi:hypothetical protein
MSCVILLQSQIGDISVYVETTAGVAATGLLFSDVTVTIDKDGGGYAAPVPAIDGGTWTEVSGGWYTVRLSAADTDTLGNLTVRVEGAGLKTGLTPAFISEDATLPVSTTLSVTTTLLFGYVLDSQGAPLAGAAVSAKPLATPSVGYSPPDGYVQVTNLVTANTDSSGFFQISLVTGSQVDFFIPSANYRRTLEVPVTSTNVFDIP